MSYTDRAGAAQTAAVPPGGVTVETEYGSLTVNPDGTYSYTLEIAADHGGGAVSEQFGFDVDLANIIAKHLGVTLELKRTKWDAIIPTLVSGEVDLIISGMTATPERALKVSYSEPYFHTITCFLVSKKRAGACSRWAKISQRSVATTLRPTHFMKYSLR